MSGDGRVVVLGLDGVPASFLMEQLDAGRMPHLARLLARRGGSPGAMDSILPCVSSVAWTSFMTGVNPGKHNIFGFVERAAGSYDLHLPTTRDIRAPTIQQIASRAGKRVISIAMPISFPPVEINGVMVGCFLTPSLDRAAHPPSFIDRLRRHKYIIDIEPWKAREDLSTLHPALCASFTRRASLVTDLLANDTWDLFLAHFIDTDRLHHFLWRHQEENDPTYAPLFQDLYARVDAFLGEVDALVPEDVLLVLASDHGFCSVIKEVYLSTWLAEKKLCAFSTDTPKSLEDLDPARTQVYALDPGRLYINVKGRDPGGIVETGAEYDALVDELTDALLTLTDPDTDARCVSRVQAQADVFSGPASARGPDLVALGSRGYELKGGIGKRTVFGASPIEGMHTVDDALLYLSGVDAEAHSRKPQIIDCAPTMLRWLGLPDDPNMDGQSLI